MHNDTWDSMTDADKRRWCYGSIFQTDASIEDKIHLAEDLKNYIDNGLPKKGAPAMVPVGTPVVG